MSENALERLRHWGGARRIAIVHDWLVVSGGAEKVLDALLQAFPGAEVFTLVDFLPQAHRGRLDKHRVHTSLIQRMPLARRYYRHYLPLMPYAIEQFDLRDFDLVISSSHCVAKGVITHSGQRHLCYCHTPMRYAWDMKEAYLVDAHFRLPGMEALVRRTLGRLRQWDHFTASQVDRFVANSANVSRRIAKYYGRGASVIHPPVDLDAFTPNDGAREDYYLAASRLVAYKRLDLIIRAFRDMPERRLKVVGDGPERGRLAALARGCPNIELLGFQPDPALRELMARARGFVFAADEDFGIMPLEAQACGTPVIAYGRGGALETVRETPDAQATGLFFHQQSAASLSEALARFEQRRYDPHACRRQAERFAPTGFWERWMSLLEADQSETDAVVPNYRDNKEPTS
ncbi:glycosyltransferase [Halomonas campisalis]|uniref:Glycosyltransferase n=1 Tax=Billgrantia campisalis TaxID=74661 RepID=A0ABS9P8S0_9GAMM|nr:glycosyltransferase [Halomonas campisalis]MCG6658031.1 glycosyltransferase [Halomonas campisalis]MDR5862698.1 glycosyltransferase [Halomonas campisalis]